MAKKGSGLTIIQRPNGSWRAQIRKVGFPYESKDFLSHDAADEWGLRRLAEIQSTGRLVDRRPAERTTLATAIEAYIGQVTAKRPSENSRISEEARLRRFLREEGHLCGHALAHVTSDMMEAWRDRRLTEKPSRGKVDGRGQRREKVVPAGRIRKDGTPRKNAALPKLANPTSSLLRASSAPISSGRRSSASSTVTLRGKRALAAAETLNGCAKFAQLDMVFHDQLAASAGNDLVIGALSRLHTHVHLFRLVATPKATNAAVDEHDAILTAIGQRDPDPAEIAMRAHVVQSRVRFGRD